MKNQLTTILLCLLVAACGPQETTTTETADVANLKAEINNLKQKANYMPGLIHNVFFWLREDLTEEERAAFLEGVKSLGTVNTVRAIYIGPPAPTEERGVVDNSFSYALLVHFDDLEGQNAYQIDPIHLRFVEDHQDKWTKVTVYDNTLIE